MLKASSARWFFLKHKLDFLKLAIRDDNKYAIAGQKQELERIINHEKIKNPAEHNRLYLEAIKYIADTVVHGKKDIVINDQDTALYLYILHKAGYFENYFLVPDRAMGIDFTDNKVELIPEVYGKYFLFYDYLKERATELNIPDSGVIIDEKEKPVKPQGNAELPVKPQSKIRLMKGQTLMDIWEPGSMGKYYRVMKSLENFEFENGRKLVEKRDSKYHWLPAPTPKKWQMYLAAFCHEMELAKLINPEKYNGSIPVLQEILKHTFNIAVLSPDSFSSIKNTDDSVYSDYKKPFKNILREIKSN